MPYSNSLITNNKIDVKKVLIKMDFLKASHLKNGTTKKLSESIAFEFGRELIGFDVAEDWRIDQQWKTIPDSEMTIIALN